MPSKYIPLPPKNIGGFIYNNGSALRLITIIPPHPVSVPLKMSKEGIRSAVNDYFCHKCDHRAELNEETRELSSVEISRYCKQQGKCPGSKRFATPGCLAGYNQESDMFRVANAEFTTHYLGLEAHYNVTAAGNLSKVPTFKWRCFSNNSLEETTYYRNFNVYGDGKVCWGQRSKPSNPSVAYNEFFGSLTNSDLTGCSGRSLKYAIENYQPEPSEWVRTADLYDRSYIISRYATEESHPITGVIISNNKNWLETAHEADLSFVYGRGQYFIGWIRKTSAGTEVICGKKLVYLTDKLTSTSKIPTILGTRKELNL
jgi:hypothetical protein